MDERNTQPASSGRSGIWYMLLLCAAGVVLNLLAAAFAAALRLPIYFDTLGTIFAAALGGYLPGVVAGFFTNVILGIRDSAMLYYGVINMVVALCVAAFAHKGYFKRFPKVLAVIPLVTLIAGVLGANLTWFLNDSNIGGQFTGFALRMYERAGFGRFGAQMAADLLYELLDKTLSVLLVYFILKLLPETLQKRFHLHGVWQAPLPPETEEAVNRQSGRRISLRLRVLLMLTAGLVFISAVAVIISHTLYKDSTISEHITMARGITKLVTDALDAERTDEFIEKGHDAEGYDETEKALYLLRDSYPDVEYLYVYKIVENGCQVVFDLDTPEEEGWQPGEIVDFDESFEPYLPMLFRGEPIEPIITDDTYGWLLTVYTPVRDHTGTTRCYAAVDFSMNIISVYSTIFIAKLVSLMLGVFIFVLAVALSLAENNVIRPVKTMAYCAGAFAYDSEAAREGNVQQLRELDIRTGDEIEELYHAFLKTTEDSMNYVDNLLHARLQVEVMREQVSVMDALAYKDALTGLKNKTSYDQYTKRLDEDIIEQRAVFGIAMIDLNFLKRINDTYGHEHGNDYIRCCCHLVCTVFEHSPVFRVGGDEFVVILENSDLAEQEKLVGWFRYETGKKAKDEELEPWERVSAAIGVAVYDPAADRCAEDVFKRADQEMYANKQAMKAVRTD